MATTRRNSNYQIFYENPDGFSIGGGTVSPRLLTVTGGDVGFVGSGNTNSFYFPNTGGTVMLQSTIVSVTSSTYTFSGTSGETILLVNAISNVVTVNLPSAVNNAVKLTVKKIDSSSNTVITDPSGAETVDGATSMEILFQNTSFSIVSDNVNWYRI